MDAWAEWASRGESSSWEDNYVYLLRWHDLAYVIAGTLYFPTVYGLQSFMRTREPFSLKPLLVCWNALLALYSFYSSIYLFPILYQLVRPSPTPPPPPNTPPLFLSNPRHINTLKIIFPSPPSTPPRRYPRRSPPRCSAGLPPWI